LSTDRVHYFYVVHRVNPTLAAALLLLGATSLVATAQSVDISVPP
jgi:hypothetical protein